MPPCVEAVEQREVGVRTIFGRSLGSTAFACPQEPMYEGVLERRW